MKNFKLLLVLLAFMLTTAVMAGNPNKEKMVKTQLSEEITKMFGESTIDLPQESVTTTVTFTLNKKNKIVLIDVECDCPGVVGFVEEKLSYQKLHVANVNVGSIYSLPIKLVRE